MLNSLEVDANCHIYSRMPVGDWSDDLTTNLAGGCHFRLPAQVQACSPCHHVLTGELNVGQGASAVSRIPENQRSLFFDHINSVFPVKN